MNAGDHIAIVLNAAAGTGRTPPDAAALRAAFAAHGLQAAVFECTPEGDLGALLRRALAASPSLLVGAGGDGTVAAVAAAAVAHDLPFGVLPLGTLNHFARDLGLPAGLEDAVATIAAHRLRAVDVGEVNGQLFLNNAGIGLYPQIVVDRERQQQRLARGKWLALLHATWRTLRRSHGFDVLLDIDGRTQRTRTSSVFVGNNPYVVEGPRMGQRERLDGGLLAVYVMRPRTVPGWVWLAVRALCGRLREDDVEAHVAREFGVEAAGAQLLVSRDGEAHPLATPLRFAIRPRALRVCMPAEAPP